MRPRPLPIIAAVLSVALIGMLVAWFLTSFERVPFDVDSGYSGEAARNPLYAAELFLGRCEVEARSLRSLHEADELPPADGALIIPFSRLTLGPTRSTELLAWVERGGHLVISASDSLLRAESAMSDPLLEALGIEAWRSPSDGEDSTAVPLRTAQEPELPVDQPSEQPTEQPLEPNSLLPGAPTEDGVVTQDLEPNQPQPVEAELDDVPPVLWGDVAGLGAFGVEEETVEIQLAEEAAPLVVALSSEIVDGAGEAIWTVHGSNAALALRFVRDRGAITVFGAAEFMRNQRIGEHDHAELVYRLATWDGRGGPVWLVHGDDVPSLLALAGRHGWRLLLSAGVLLGLWLLARARRHGPLQPLPDPARRRLSEHVEASGRMLWTRGASGVLLRAAQQAVMQRAATRTPLWENMSPRERHARLADLSELPPEAIEADLNRSEVDGPGQFLATVRRLERIRRAL